MADRKIFGDSISPLPEDTAPAPLPEGTTPAPNPEGTPPAPNPEGTPPAPIHGDKAPAPLGAMLNRAKTVDRTQSMNLVFSLNMDAALQKDLEAKVAAGQVVSPQELKQKYVPDPQQIDGLVQWLNAQGFTDTRVSPNGTAVYATGSVPVIENSLQVTMVSVVKDGVTYIAAKDAPSLPAEIAQQVHAIIGLQPFRHVNKHRRAPTPSREIAPNDDVAPNNHDAPNDHDVPNDDAADTSSPPAQPAARTPNTPPYLVSEILKAYNADGLGVTGKGQTIAILINAFAADSDLTAFWAENKITASLDQIQKINVTNANLPAPQDEETLDTEWASGIAPGATIRVYAAASLNFVDLDAAMDALLNDVETIPGMRQLSISLGLGETFMGGPQGVAAAAHQKFLRLAAAGVNVFVSAGDAGSNPDGTGQIPTGPVQVEYAASDPSVIAVGGTTLVLAPDGTVAGETAWATGGGGQSIFFPRPSWQIGIDDTTTNSTTSGDTATSDTTSGSTATSDTTSGSTATSDTTPGSTAIGETKTGAEATSSTGTATTTTTAASSTTTPGPATPTAPPPMRLVPDVSLSADPHDGANLILNGKSIMIGGTSWAAPVWAGFCALMNEARANAGKPFLPFLNPLIYPLRGTAAFRDITTGTNGAYNAGSGYDMVTGLGVPNLVALIGALP